MHLSLLDTWWSLNKEHEAGRLEVRARDFIIGAIGIIGALNVFGVLGRFFFLFLPFMWFASVFIVVFALAALVYKRLSGRLTGVEFRRYMFYTITNTLPTAAILLANYLELRLWER